jgi:hypothetical protein
VRNVHLSSRNLNIVSKNFFIYAYSVTWSVLNYSSVAIVVLDVSEECRVVFAAPWNEAFDVVNLKEPCVLYIGRAYRYPPCVAFYIYFFNKYKY